MNILKEVIFRSAEPRDAALVAQFIRELADYEKLSQKVHVDEDALEQHLASNHAPQLYVIIAECGSKPVGMAIYYMRYSTFNTSWGLHL